ncbi:MAG: MFS transporter [Sphingomonas sp.]
MTKQPDRTSIGTWLTLALFTALFALANIDRSLVSILAEPIKREFALSDAQLGVLTGLAFAIPYTIAGVPMGMLIDRVNRVRLAHFMASLWAAVTILVGLMSSYSGMAAIRALLGAAESSMAPTFTSLTSDLFPTARRATAMAILYISSPIGLLLGFSFGGLIGAHYGWRASFVVAGVVGIVAAMGLLLVREPLRGRYDGAAGAPAGGSPATMLGLVRLFRQRPALLLLTIAGSSSIAAQSGLSAFAAPFLIRVLGMTLQNASLALAMAFGVGGMIGMLGGGLIADRVRARFPDSVLLFAAAVATLAAIAAFVAFGVAGPTVALVGLGVYAILCVAHYGVIFSTFVSLTPPAMRGSAMAVLLIAQNLVGYGFGPPVMGALSDWFKASGVPQPLRYAMMAMTAFYLFAALMFYLANRRVVLDRAVPAAA